MTCKQIDYLIEPESEVLRESTTGGLMEEKESTSRDPGKSVSGTGNSKGQGPKVGMRVRGWGTRSSW